MNWNKIICIGNIVALTCVCLDKRTIQNKKEGNSSPMKLPIAQLASKTIERKVFVWVQRKKKILYTDQFQVVYNTARMSTQSFQCLYSTQANIHLTKQLHPNTCSNAICFNVKMEQFFSFFTICLRWRPFFLTSEWFPSIRWLNRFGFSLATS